MNWNELNIKDRADLIKKAIKDGIYNLNDIRNTYNTYANGGYKPSNSIKKDISIWEGSSMKTNRSFEAEAKDFNKYLPKEALNKLSQQQLDALYSYSYNVGAGNFNKRVVPVLNKYLQGNATKEDVQKSMWATKDNQLRGLTKRRNWEREKFGGNYRSTFNNNLSNIPNNLSNTSNFYDNNTFYNNSNTFYNNIEDMTTKQKDYINNYKGILLGDTEDNKYSFNINEAINNILSSIVPSYVTPIVPNIEYNNQNILPDYSYMQSYLTDYDNTLYGNNIDENEIFAKGGPINKTYQGNITHLKDVDYQKWRANLPTNLRTENDNYNLYEAYKSGAQPILESDGYYHLPSRNPRTNKILKKPTHSTYGVAIREDAAEGYLPIYKNGETYTYPLPWIERNEQNNNKLYPYIMKANGGYINKFNDGGNTVDNNEDYTYIDADNLRHRDFLNLNNVDGKLMDSNNNHYNLLALDREHTPVIQGINLLAKKMAEDMAYANAKKYFDPNTTMNFINATVAPITNFSPSNIVGSIRNANDYTTFMDSFMNQNNSGFFTEKYAKEHPYISTLGNIGGDILFDKGVDLYRDVVNNSILYKKGLTKLRQIGKKLGIRNESPLNRYYNTIDNYNKAGVYSRGINLFDYWDNPSYNRTYGDNVLAKIANKSKSEFFDEYILGNKQDLEALKNYYQKYARRLTKEQEEAIAKKWGDRGISIMRNNPEYFDFIKENPTMNPFNQSTVDAFLKRQSLSLRGVHSNNPMNAEKFLTQTEVNRKMPGGDRLNTKGGLYTSNSKDIGNRFKNAEVGTEDGYLAELYHNWNIDSSLPIEEQLNQWRQKVLYDASFGKHSLIYPLNRAYKPKANRMLYENPNIEAIEAEYGRSNGQFLAAHERAYLPPKGETGTKGKPVNIEKVDFFPSTTNQNDRWEAGVADDNFFINKDLNNTTDFIRDARILLSKTYGPSNLQLWNQTASSINNQIRNRTDKLLDLANKAETQYRKVENFKDTMKPILFTTGTLGIPLVSTLGIIKYKNNKDLNFVSKQLEADDRRTKHNLSDENRKFYEAQYYLLTGKNWKSINKNKDK